MCRVGAPTRPRRLVLPVPETFAAPTISGALDPNPDLGAAAVIHRLDALVDIFSLHLMAWNAAREDGWRVARVAMEHHEGEGQQAKAWQASVAVARKKAGTDSGGGSSAKGGGNRAPNSPRRGGRGGKRGGKQTGKAAGGKSTGKG